MIQAAVDQLLALKAEFKALTGTDYGPPPVAKPVEDKVVSGSYFVTLQIAKTSLDPVEISNLMSILLSGSETGPFHPFSILYN